MLQLTCGTMLPLIVLVTLAASGYPARLITKGMGQPGASQPAQHGTTGEIKTTEATQPPLRTTHIRAHTAGLPTGTNVGVKAV